MYAVGMVGSIFALMGLLAVFSARSAACSIRIPACIWPRITTSALHAHPVPSIMASRLLGVYLMGLMYSGVVILPAVIVYWIMVSASAAAIAGGVLLVALISLFVLTLSCALGWAVAKISRSSKQELYHRFRLARVPSGLLFLLFQGADAYPGSCCECRRLRREHPAQCLTALSLWPRRHRRPAGDGHCVRCFWPHSSCCAVPAHLPQLPQNCHVQRQDRAQGPIARHAPSGSPPPPRCCGRSSPASTASPNYMLNCGLGTLMLPIAGVVLLVYQAKIRDLELLLGAEFASLLFIAAVCLLPR